ncbi:MAG: YhgE/Pip domain-containing protein [Candidatus Carbobacillus sp.]|uniref:Phage infection protein n=1 Tax=Candidatus Carbonibacillus altaicus TaxID=2163959 RepID=A0A2R6XYB4_9BACL|nr:YhgE/Pip domain-containing protein [Candidatus Carbobacillus sp.]PTQ55403.1 MAG: Phage infection protein [Candidatus Carbobacillus altaicus]
MRKSIASLAQVIQMELGLFKMYQRLTLAAIVVALIPTLYVFMYLSSIWNPYGELHNLPVGLVNLDQGGTINGETVHLGEKIASQFIEEKPLNFRRFANPTEASEALRRGEIYSYLVIPQDFSTMVFSGTETAAVQVVIDQGMNYVATTILERTADELAKRVSAEVNRERWQAILLAARNAEQDVTRLKEGMKRLEEGSEALAAGLAQAAQGGKNLAQAQAQLREGLPSLREGTNTLTQGLYQTRKGSEELNAGARRLFEGAKAMQLDVHSLSDRSGVADQEWNALDKNAAVLVEGAERLSKGVNQLVTGITRLSEGGESLSRGVHQAEAGAETLTQKGQALSEALERLNNGAVDLAAGMRTLARGLEGSSFTLPEIKANPHVLANPVNVQSVKQVAVETNGQSLSPYFMALALWIGALIATFLFRATVLPEDFKRIPFLLQVLGKYVVPVLVILLAVVLLSLVIWLGFGVPVRHLEGYYLMLLAGGFGFLSITLGLVMLLGDAGKLVSVVFLVFQLSAAGGVFPIELSTPFYQAVHPLLPVTHLVKGLRAAMFGSYGGAWEGDALWLLAWSGVGLGLGFLSRQRWHYVHREQYGPALHF